MILPAGPDGRSGEKPDPNGADRLEAWFAEGLHEALRDVVPPDRNQPSTLQWLARRGDGNSPGLAGSTPEAPASLSGGSLTHDAMGGAALSKYEILGAIGSGGMGTVLRGYDCNLGRDIAVKLLHGRHCDNPDLVRRFFAEARICGQLQHPGIVPVYDLGSDGERPYFTMKLVEGRTLATLLDARTSLSTDRQGHLRVFEQVCQTMAYAHARGVIHGDLKPANVMVGEFGEVQVMDWGFARNVAPVVAAPGVVRATDTVPDPVLGSVFGTPGYMPREQALGEIARMDARSDAFALGSILCEILTGSPAYSGDQESALAKARAGATQDARARLRASDAERDLTALAEECLAVEVESRPRSAQAVADRIGAHLASAARRAEAARFKVMSAKRSQRWTLALAAGFALVLALGTAGTLWLQHRSRELDLAEVVRLQMDTARQALHAAESAKPDEPKWRLATAAAERALQVARDRGAGHELVDAADSQCALVARGRADAFLRAALERIRIPQNHCLSLGTASNREARRRYHGYEKELAAYGLDPLTATPDQIAGRIRASSIVEDLVMALDDWALAALTVALWGETGKPEMRTCSRRLLAAANASDPDVTRAGVRAILARETPSGPELVQLLDLGPTATLPRTTVLLAARALCTLHETGPAVQLLSDAQRESSGDFWLAFELALAHELSSTPDWKAASRFYELADVLRPDLYVVQSHRAYALAKSGEAPEAELLMRRALLKNSQDANAQNVLGVILSEQRRFEEAQVQFRIAMSLDRGCTIACSNLGRMLFILDHGAEARQCVEGLGEGTVAMAAAHRLLADIAAEGHGTLEEALEEYERALDLQPDFAEARYSMALVQRRLGYHEPAQRSLEKAARNGWKSPEGWEDSLRLELAALAGDASGAAFEPKLLLARKALEQQRYSEAAHLYADAGHIEPLSPQSWDAVCAAVLATSASSPEGGAAEQDRCRRFARERLSAEFEILRGAARSPLAADRLRAEAHLTRWLRDPDLDAVRAKARLEQMPREQAAEWLFFWQDVREELPH
jgi:serine/threonine protein kinase/Tfp pilus assembly protein PilF